MRAGRLLAGAITTSAATPGLQAQPCAWWLLSNWHQGYPTACDAAAAVPTAEPATGAPGAPAVAAHPSPCRERADACAPGCKARGAYTHTDAHNRGFTRQGGCTPEAPASTSTSALADLRRDRCCLHGSGPPTAVACSSSGRCRSSCRSHLGTVGEAPPRGVNSQSYGPAPRHSSRLAPWQPPPPLPSAPPQLPSALPRAAQPPSPRRQRHCHGTSGARSWHGEPQHRRALCTQPGQLQQQLPSQQQEHSSEQQQQQQPAGRAAPVSAAALLAPLLEGRPFHVAQIPGRGRGLVASRPIAAGEVVHEEAPLLAFPALEARHKVCYHCLAALPAGAAQAVRHRPTGRWFCCPSCRAAALAQYHAVEEEAAAASAAAAASSGSFVPSNAPGERGDGSGGGGGGPLAELYEQCREHGERFPLMAARLAFMRVAAAVRQHLAASAPPSTSAPPPPAPVAATQAGDTSRSAAPDPLSSLHVLCFANVGPPYPDPWVAQHELLAAALRALEADGAALRRLAVALQGPSAEEEGAGSQQRLGCDGAAVGAAEVVEAEAGLAAAVREAVEELSVEWFVGVLARLHLNVFQVHNPLAGADPSDLAAAAAALVSDSGGGAASAGSAAYLLASLFNHSCDPSLELCFPGMDGTAAFVAARDVAAGEELSVSYLDVGLPYDVRRRHLEWSYGFVCGCARCREEAAEAEAEAGKGV